MNKFFHDAGFLIATEIALRLKGLVLLPLLTRHLGAVNYGVWAQVALIVGLVTPIVASGLDSAATRFFPGLDKDKRRAEFSAVTVYLILASGVFAVLLWAISEPVANFLLADSEQARFVSLAGLLTITGFMIQIARLYLRIADQAKLLGVTNVAHSALNTGAMVVVLLRDGDIADVVTWTIGADAILAAGLLVYILARRGLGVPRFSALGYLLRFGVVLIPAGYSLVIINWIDRIFLVNYRDLAAIGHYSVAYSLGYLVIAVVFNPIWLMYPTKAAELYSADDEAGIASLRNVSITLAMLVVVPVVVGWFLLGGHIVEIVAGAEFVAGAHVIWMISVGYSFLMIGAYFDIGLGLYGMQRWSSIAMGFGVVVNLALNWALIPQYGLTGAALATLVAFVVQAGISFTIHSRKVRTSFDLIPVAKILVASAVMLIPLAILDKDTPLNLVGTILAGVIIYLAAIFILKPLTVAQVRAGVGVAEGDAS